MNLTATSVLSLFETTKEERFSFVMKVIDELPYTDPLKVHLQIRCMEEIIKILKENTIYKSSVLEAAEKHGKCFSFMHSKMEIREAGVKYDYSVCGDKVLDELEAEQKEIEEAIKERQAFLKNLPDEGITRVDETTGEIWKLYPPLKSSTPTVVITLK